MEMEKTQLFAAGKLLHPETDAGATIAIDTYNIAGRDQGGGGEKTLQMLLDAIAEKVDNRLLEKTEVASWAKQPVKPSYSATEVGADEAGSAKHVLEEAKEYSDRTYQQVTAYTNRKVEELVGGAGNTMDTLEKIANAVKKNESASTELKKMIGDKANNVELEAHVSNGTQHITNRERNEWREGMKKLDGITDDADAVSFRPALNVGVKIGVITINGEEFEIYAPEDKTYSVATTSAAGLMSNADKGKLDGIEEGANKTITTTSLMVTVPGISMDAMVGAMLVERINSQNSDFTDRIAGITNDLNFENIARDKYKDNLLQVSISVKKHDANKTRLVLNPSTNSPVDGTFLGVWKCCWYDSAHLFVKVEEFYPVCGRIWTNFYNNTEKWSGWKSVTPQ